MSLNSAAAELLEYGRTRIARPRVAMLVAGLTALTFFAEPPLGAGDVVLRIGLAMLLVVSFRIWDDVADRAYDRAHHPDRLLSRSSAPWWIWTMLAVATASAATGAYGGEASLRAFGGLVVLIAIVYHGPWRITRERFVRTQLMLFKYPAFIAILGVSGVTSRTVLCGAAGYLLVSLHEWHDDPVLRERHCGGQFAVALVVCLIAAMSLVVGND